MEKSSLKFFTLLLSIIIIYISLFYTIERSHLFNWTDSYRITSKEPFGLYVFNTLIKKKFGKENVEYRSRISQEFLDSLDNNTSIIYINKDFYLEKEKSEFLAKNFYKGKQLFLVTSSFNSLNSNINVAYKLNVVDTFDIVNQNKSFAYHIDTSVFKFSDEWYLEDYLQKNYKKIFSRDSSRYVNKEDDSFKINFEPLELFIKDRMDYPIFYKISESLYPSKETVEDENQVDKIYSYPDSLMEKKIDLYIHLLPEMFTNSATYLNGYTDNFNIFTNQITGKKIVITTFDFDYTINRNPFQYMLKNKHLKYAYYTALFAILLLFIFGIKRWQRGIKVINAKTNTSVEYIDTMAALYKQEDQYFLVKRMTDNFYFDMSKRFYLQRNEKNYSEILAKKSKISKELIDNILNYFDLIEKNKKCSDDQLIFLNSYLNTFYKKLDHGEQ